MNKAPAIIPPERIVETVSRAGVEGYFEVELIHKPTGLIKQKLRFKNLITTAGLDFIGNSSAGGYGPGVIFGSSCYMAVGTGNNTPSVGDTGLQTEVYRTNSAGSPTIPVVYGRGPDSDYYYVKTTRVFFPGQATGNLTEVGISQRPNDASQVMWARQLFKDGAGNPVTIVKTSDDELRVSYELRMYTMKTSSISTITVKSISRTCTTQGYDIDANDRWGSTTGASGLLYFIGNTTTYTNYQELYSSSIMPALTSTQTGGITNPSSVSWGSYTGAYYNDQSSTYNPGLGNLTVGSITWGGGYGVAAPFITTIEPAISKTDTERFTFTGRLSWGRYTP